MPKTSAQNQQAGAGQPLAVWKRLLALLAIAGLVVVDQQLKRWATQNLRGGMRVAVPFVLQLRYTQNTGISFSLFGKNAAAMQVVSVVTGLVLLGGLAMLLLGRLRLGTFVVGVAPILAGGISNLIDRLRLGYVVDYFEFAFVRFAIFNWADVCISFGVLWLGLCMARTEWLQRKELRCGNAHNDDASGV